MLAWQHVATHCRGSSAMQRVPKPGRLSSTSPKYLIWASRGRSLLQTHTVSWYITTVLPWYWCEEASCMLCWFSFQSNTPWHKDRVILCGFCPPIKIFVPMQIKWKTMFTECYYHNKQGFVTLGPLFYHLEHSGAKQSRWQSVCLHDTQESLIIGLVQLWWDY